jgi:hypothetical protein
MVLAMTTARHQTQKTLTSGQVSHCVEEEEEIHLILLSLLCKVLVRRLADLDLPQEINLVEEAQKA